MYIALRIKTYIYIYIYYVYYIYILILYIMYIIYIYILCISYIYIHISNKQPRHPRHPRHFVGMDSQGPAQRLGPGDFDPPDGGNQQIVEGFKAGTWDVV